jgi:hypothetical protein
MGTPFLVLFPASILALVYNAKQPISAAYVLQLVCVCEGGLGARVTHEQINIFQKRIGVNYRLI